MAEWVTGIVEAAGYWGILLLMVLENVFPPIPSELIMPLGGFASARGELSFSGVVAAGTAGSVLGALPFYYLGRFADEARLKRWADRYGGWLTIGGDDIDRASAWFDQKGGTAVFLCRLVPGVRSLISIPAGMGRMPMLPFLLYTTLGTGLRAAALAWAGRLLGDNYDRVGVYIGPASYVVFGLLALALVAWIVLRKRRIRGREAAAEA